MPLGEIFARNEKNIRTAWPYLPKRVFIPLKQSARIIGSKLHDSQFPPLDLHGRGLLIVHGRKDGLHHHHTVERTAQSVATIYDQIGYPHRMRLQWGEEGHRYYPRYMWPFAKTAFFSKTAGQ